MDLSRASVSVKADVVSMVYTLLYKFTTNSPISGWGSATCSNREFKGTGFLLAGKSLHDDVVWRAHKGLKNCSPHYHKPGPVVESGDDSSANGSQRMAHDVRSTQPSSKIMRPGYQGQNRRRHSSSRGIAGQHRNLEPIL
jgi:hypothetical protein